MFFLKRKVILRTLLTAGIIFSAFSVHADEAEELAAQIASQKSTLAEEMQIIVDQHYELGKELYNDGDYEKALEEFNTVLDIDTGNADAKDFRMKCINAIAGNPVESVEPVYTAPVVVKSSKRLTKNQENAIKAYRQGLDYFIRNQKDDAIHQLRISIELDPYYMPAKRLIRRLLGNYATDLEKDRDVLADTRINEVREAWLPTGRANKLTISGPNKQMEIVSDAKRKMLDSSEQIIPEINFTQAHLRDVLQYLSKITGVNIILDEYIFEGTFQGGVTEIGGMEVEDQSMGGAAMSDTITISLTNIPLIEALRYILKIKGLKFRIDDYAILVSTPERIGSDEMETRYYNLSAGIGDFTEFRLNADGTDPGIKSDGGGAFGGDGLEVEEKVGIKDVLLNSGVPFPPGSSVFMDKRTGTLIVHNTPENLTMVERILEIIDKPPFQVNIQSKFVRIMQSDLEELGFEWMLNSSMRLGDKEGGANRMQIDADTSDTLISNPLNGAINGIDTSLQNLLNNSAMFSVSGILTDPQFKVIVHALDKNGNTDLLSAPSVTTVNNQQAQIELVDEIIYPSEYDLQPPTVSDDGDTVTPGLAVPGDFVTRDVGVILNVTPSVGADRKTITLTLMPEVSELKDWKDYGVHYENAIYDPVTQQTLTVRQDIPIEQPIFHTSNVSTSVIVNDGETIVLGGLIEEKKFTVHDKTPFLGDIPFLGRLFRHDYEQSQKMNLMIFVTAKLITASGEDLHPSARK